MSKSIRRWGGKKTIVSDVSSQDMAKKKWNEKEVDVKERKRKRERHEEQELREDAEVDFFFYASLLEEVEVGQPTTCLSLVETKMAGTGLLYALPASETSDLCSLAPVQC